MTSAIGKTPRRPLRSLLIKERSAFSFIELLVATAILSIGIVVILQAFSFTGRIAGLTFDLTNAVLLAENKMQDWEFKEKQGSVSAELAEDKGTTGGFYWRSTLKLDPDLQLYHLNYSLTWKRANREEEMSLDTYLR